MLINLRNALMAGKRLPYDAEVEYLESTGTQYIETGVTRGQTSQLRLQSTMSFSGSASADAFGWGQSLQGPCVGIKRAQPYMYFNLTGTDEYSTLTYTANTVVTIDIDGASGKVTINDGTTTYIATRTVSTWTDSGEMVLFGFTNSAGVQPRNQRIYACKIYVNGVLVRDYIPVRRGTVGYLYDRVSRKLFGNAGTGDFQYGPDVVPVEYIESHGAEYINTGLLGRDGYDFEYRFRPQNPLPLGIGGEYESNQSCYIGLVRSNGNLAYNYSNPNVIVEVQSLTLGTDYNVKAHLYSGEQYFEVNGVRGGVGSRTGVFTSSYNLYLFAINSANQPTSLGVMRLYNLTAHLNTIPIRSFRPVRVGTEGAMMDVLTRRIYRNAGTGAFTYGNDLPYPIPAE